jgi:hypothetical protein
VISKENAYSLSGNNRNNNTDFQNTYRSKKVKDSKNPKIKPALCGINDLTK